MMNETLGKWPRLDAEVRSNGVSVEAIVRYNGTPSSCAAPTSDVMRAGIIARCVQHARALNRPIAAHINDGGTVYDLAVRPTGIVHQARPGDPLPPADGLEAMHSPCHQCGHPASVADTVCPQCGTEEPLRVETAPRLKPITLSGATEHHKPAPEPEQTPDPAPTGSGTTTGNAAPDVELIDTSSRTHRMNAPEPDHTVVVPRPAAAARLIVHIDNGETVHVTAPAVLGRRPRALDGHAPVVVASPGKMVSRTHATIDVDDAGNLIITDHDSANGTLVDDKPLAPYSPTIISAGARIVLGDATVRPELVKSMSDRNLIDRRGEMPRTRTNG